MRTANDVGNERRTNFVKFTHSVVIDVLQNWYNTEHFWFLPAVCVLNIYRNGDSDFVSTANRRHCAKTGVHASARARQKFGGRHPLHCRKVSSPPTQFVIEFS